MKVLNVEEHDDGSATIGVDLTPEELKIVVEEGLKRVIENTMEDLEDE